MSGFYISDNPPGDLAVALSSGWETHNDGEYTELSPFTVADGTSAALPNDDTFTNLSQSPLPSAPLYDGVATRVTPNDAGDAYILRVSMVAYTSSNNGGFSVSIDISAAGDGSITVASEAVRALRGMGPGSAQLYTVSLPLFALETFKANGGAVRVEAINGDLTLHTIQYFITKTHKGRE